MGRHALSEQRLGGTSEFEQMVGDHLGVVYRTAVRLAGQTAAREALRLASVRFQAGVGTQLEVVTGIQNLATADNEVIQAGLNYFVAVAQLDRATGVQVKI